MIVIVKMKQRRLNDGGNVLLPIEVDYHSIVEMEAELRDHGAAVGQQIRYQKINHSESRILSRVPVTLAAADVLGVSVARQKFVEA